MSGGMDMGTNLFQSTNMSMARIFWYMIAGVVGLTIACRWAFYYQWRQRSVLSPRICRWTSPPQSDHAYRLRTCSTSAVQYPTRPTNRVEEFWATITAVGREISYPQLYIPSRWFSWATPPSMGRVIILLVYWAVIIFYMASDAIVFDAYFWERIGFRSAWVTVMQVPLLYLLATKCSILGIFAGISYERMNWMHRWVARTMFVTGAVHGWHFYQEWVLADFVQLEFEMMPIIKYGIGAWAILGLQLVIGFAPIRHLAYEVFVAQHILSAAFFLWLLYVHVPSYAVYNVWFAIAALCFDRVYRIVLLLWQNIKLFPDKSKCKGGQRIGHHTQVKAIGDSITVLTIKDVHFRWRPGQHLYLWIPQIGIGEAHPYTIACAHRLSGTCICNSIQLVVRKHKGFSRRIHDFAMKAEAVGKKETLTAFVTGPYGVPPRWNIYETLILVSASTGASFTLPILESVLRAKQKICTKRIDFLLAAKQGEEINFYVQRLHEFISLASNVGIELSVYVAVTRDPSSSVQQNREPSVLRTATASSSGSAIGLTEDAIEKPGGASPADVEKSAASLARFRPGSSASNDSHVHQLTSRPDIESFIRGPVEATGGETSVVVCGGKSLVSRVRNCVASLSDERAVHKGTGAQGIHLHVEEYCF